MNFFKWLTKIDRRWIYLLMAIVVAFPILTKLKGTIKKPSKSAVKLYQFVDKLGEDNTIMFTFDYSPDSLAELHPMAKAVMYHAFEKNLRIIGIAPLWPTAAGIGLDVMQSQVNKYNQEIILKNYMNEFIENSAVKEYMERTKKSEVEIKKIITTVVAAYYENDNKILEVNREFYKILDENNLLNKVEKNRLKLKGRDWVYFGYKPGFTSIMLGMGKDIPKTIVNDYSGTPIIKYEMFSSKTKKVKSFDDISIVIDFAAGASVDYLLQYVNTKFGRPLGAGVTAVMAADYYPYIQSGQLVGMLNGMRGAADYETLIKQPGRGLNAMASQTYAHLLIILFIILGNIGYLVTKKGDEK